MLCHRDDVRAILLCSSPITIAWFTHALCAGLSGSKRRCDHITCRWPLPRDHRTSRALCHHGVGRRGGDLEKPDGPNCLRLSCLVFLSPFCVVLHGGRPAGGQEINRNKGYLDNTQPSTFPTLTRPYIQQPERWKTPK